MEEPRHVPQEDLVKISQELVRARIELTILYEISNAMRTTLKLDEVLYIILTGVTAHVGLGFNRAMLFLVNEKESFIEGKMSIGPESGEEANRIWNQIEHERKGMDDLINAYKVSRTAIDSGLNKQLKHLKIPLKESQGGLLALCVLDGMPLHLTKETMPKYVHDPVLSLLHCEELAVVPLKAKDKVNGIILADNFITKKPISKDDLHMLIMIANQAGLAIENSQLYEKTVTQVNLDSLTQLWNHGFFQYLLTETIEKAKAIKSQVTLIAIDIDDFKVYNDTLGHQSGDRILKDLAQLLKNQSRKMDFVCRYGGEEFMIILPQTDKREAFFIAERLRHDIERQAFVYEEIMPQKKLTVSIGLSTFPEDAATPAELIAASDKALYEAKHNGKNNTCCRTPFTAK